MKKIFFTILFLFCSTFSQDQIIQKGDVYYLANKVVVKFKESTNNSFYKSSIIPSETAKHLDNISATKVEKTYTVLNEEAINYSDINRTYVIEYSSPYDPQALSNKLSNTSGIEWAEPWYVYKISLEPNDPKYLDGTQWYLNKISASQAWDLSTGSEDIVIAIIDTGVDWDHPDLAANIWMNPGEILDGTDTDGNGFVDDIRGWDFGGTNGTPDNNPMEDAPTHGTYVAGFASAVTNNGEGIASIGYNCKIMAVKTSRQDLGNGIIAYGREGILYAANNGAKVINCSWGGSPYSQALQDAITYATSLGALVVSSADNDNKIEPAYPSAYDGVLSVGGTDANDLRYSASNYGATVDVTAPATGFTTGQGMYSTWQNDTYWQNSSGTSLASPLAAGLAGLIIQRFPDYTPLQVAEQIRVNTDYIADKNDSFFEYYLGTGRINAYKALSNANSISVRAEEFVYTDLSNGNGVVEPGEAFNLGVVFKNYLSPASNVQVSLESRSQYVTINQGNYTIGGVGTLEETNNFSSPFSFSVSEDIPVNQDVELLIKYSNGSNYNDFQLIRTKFNTTYLTQAGNNIALTITSKGNLGYNDYGSLPSEGDGLFFNNGENLLFEGALIYGSSPTMIMDAAHVDYLQNQSQDFKTLIPFSISVPGEYADYEGFTLFNDDQAEEKLGIQTELFTYSFSQEEYSDFIILRYRFTNNGDTTIQTFHAGLFFDLDFHDFDDDYTAWDFEDHFGYVYDMDPNQNSRIDDYIGVALISDTKYGYRAMSNEGMYGGINIIDGYSKEEKWLTIASATTIVEFGPGDIAFAVSGGPYTIDASDTLEVSFAIAGAYLLDELKERILLSRKAYKDLILNPVVNVPANVNLFETSIQKDTLNLIWIVTNEINTIGYKVVLNDSLVGQINVQTATNDTSIYSYKITNLKPGLNTVDIFQVFENLKELKLVSKTVDVKNDVSLEFSLSQNYPNPFNPATKIKFTLPSVGDEYIHPQQTQLIVYDILGRQITTLINSELSSGVYEVEFNGSGLSSGVYFYKLTYGSFVETKKMMLLK
ncbi:MAG TPA: T9SS type A sorting domain-containing protein [Ignavibacteria bacterium]|nr:T9SS type A sorting domain-containing protein [Ignavibacteria bacterium]